MNKPRILLYFIVITIILTGTALNNSVSFEEETPDLNSSSKNNPTTSNIPTPFSNKLKLNTFYVYNVSRFNTTTPKPHEWYNVDFWQGKRGVYYTNPGGQVKLNITGFHNKHPSDYNDFEDPIAYMDLQFLENQSGVLVVNNTFYNVSNGEAAFNLNFNFANFGAGFLIPSNKLDFVKETAEANANTQYLNAYYKMEESITSIYFGFDQYDGSSANQSSHLVYDKDTGLLVHADINFGNYTFEITLTNSTIDYNELYSFNIIDFRAPAHWNSLGLTPIDRGEFASNKGGKFVINFTGDFEKDINDPSPFTGALPYLDISIYKGYRFWFQFNFALTNISNAESSNALFLGYNNFTSGFRIPLNNLTELSEQALAQNLDTFAASITIQETNISIIFIFKQNSGNQNTTLSYDRFTGLLIGAETVNGTDYYLKCSGLTKYTWPTIEDDDDDDDKKKRQTVLSFPMTILFILSAITILAIIFKVKYRMK